MTEDPVSEQGIEASSDTPSPYTVEVFLTLGKIHQAMHSISAQNPTDINLYVKNLASQSGAEHNLPSQSSRLIPEYSSLCIWELRKIKIVHERDKKGNGIPKIFGLIDLFAYVAMYTTKSILP